VVKRNHRSEPFDEHKLRASIRAACLSIRTPAGEAEMTAERMYRQILPWLEGKAEVTSADIRRKSAEALLRDNPEAAYVYQIQRIMI